LCNYIYSFLQGFVHLMASSGVAKLIDKLILFGDKTSISQLCV